MFGRRVVKEEVRGGNAGGAGWPRIAAGVERSGGTAGGEKERVGGTVGVTGLEGGGAGTLIELKDGLKGGITGVSWRNGGGTNPELVEEDEDGEGSGGATTTLGGIIVVLGITVNSGPFEESICSIAP